MSDNSKKEDMTRIEDLSEFLHSEDSEIDDQFQDEEPPPFSENSEQDEESFDVDEFFENPDPFTEDDDLFKNLGGQDDLLENEEPEEFENSEDTLLETENFDEITLSSDEEPEEFENSEDTLLETESVDELNLTTDEEPEGPPETHFNIQEEIPEPTYLDIQPERENFKEVQDFGNAISYGKVQSGGNPAFSVILKGIDSDDFDSILSILNEHGLIGQNEEIIKQSLELGVLLIAQVSEFSAIFLANKLKQYSTDISIGLSEQIHKSKSYDKDNKGLVTKKSIYQNKDKKFIRENNRFKLEDLIITKNGQIPNTTISEHFGVIVTSKVVTFADLTRQDLTYTDNLKDAKLEINSLAIYDDLIKDLSIIAFEKGANAILSVTHSMSSLFEKDDNGEVQYQIICSGDAVVVDKT